MDYSWINTTWTSVLMVIVSTIGIYTAVIIFTRIAGLRSFSKMSSFDFAMTVAVGSLMASTILNNSPPLYQAMIGLAALYIMQMIVAKLRGVSPLMKKLVDNEPLLLMRGTEILKDHLEEARVTRGDLRARLRAANVTRLNQVKAVVMETTGDISVLHHDDLKGKPDDELLKEVRGWES